MILWLYFSIFVSLETIMARNDCYGQKRCDVANKHYERFDIPMNYERAQDWCGRFGEQQGRVGKLATIQNSEEQKAMDEMLTLQANSNRRMILNLLFQQGWGYFIGAKYSSESRSWIWNNQSKVVYSQWKNLNQNGNCAKILPNNQSSNQVSQWTSVPCNDMMFCICETDITPQFTPSCEPSDQTLVDINSFDRTVTECRSEQSERFIKGWKVRLGSEWKVKNTGKDITITPYPDHSNWMTFKGSWTNYFVDRMVLKWGNASNSGSIHSVNGRQRAGELQVYLRDIDGHFRHVFAFLIEERHSFDNQQWDKLLERINQCRQVNQTATCEAPRDALRFLLRDTLPTRSSLAFPTFIESASFRYQSSLPYPFCTDEVNWTVFPRAIQLSSSQFRQLRQVRLDQSQTSVVTSQNRVEHPSTICSLIA